MVPQCLPHQAKCLSLASKAPYNLDPLPPSQLDFLAATHTASILIRQLSNYCCTHYASPCWKYSAQNSLLTLILHYQSFSSGPTFHFNTHWPLLSLCFLNQDPLWEHFKSGLLTAGMHRWAQGVCTICKSHSIFWERGSRASLTLSGSYSGDLKGLWALQPPKHKQLHTDLNAF